MVPTVIFSLLGLLSVGFGSSEDICTDYTTQADCSGVVDISILPDCGALDSSDTRFMIIGDYGLSSSGCEGHVASLVEQFERQFDIDFAITLGDNDYWSGQCEDMEKNIGQYYGSYFQPGGSCVNPKLLGSAQQRFWPAIGNHEWDTYASANGTLPYLQYFDYLTKVPPYNGMYYNMRPIARDGQPGPVELFAVNSNWKDDTAEVYITQRTWLQEALGSSTAAFKIVYFHHPVHTTAKHDSPATWMRWPFAEWGASIVMAGHQHAYERLYIDNLVYVVNGLGGHPWLYDQSGCTPEAGSQKRYNSRHGAMMGFASQSELRFCFYSVEDSGSLIDQFALRAGAMPGGGVVSVVEEEETT